MVDALEQRLMKWRGLLIQLSYRGMRVGAQQSSGIHALASFQGSATPREFGEKHTEDSNWLPLERQTIISSWSAVFPWIKEVKALRTWSVRLWPFVWLRLSACYMDLRAWLGDFWPTLFWAELVPWDTRRTSSWLMSNTWTLYNCRPTPACWTLGKHLKWADGKRRTQKKCFCVNLSFTIHSSKVFRKIEVSSRNLSGITFGEHMICWMG